MRVHSTRHWRGERKRSGRGGHLKMQEVPMSLEERATRRGEGDLEGARAVNGIIASLGQIIGAG